VTSVAQRGKNPGVVTVWRVKVKKDKGGGLDNAM